MAQISEDGGDLESMSMEDQEDIPGLGYFKNILFEVALHLINT